MKSLLYLSCITLSIGLLSCKKDVIPELQSQTTDDCDCIDIPPIEGYSFGYNYEFDEQYTFWPVLNPNNDHDMIFCEWDGLNKIVYRYNAVTKEKVAIYTGNIVAKPDWGKHDDIVFTLYGGTLWKMKPDGSQVTQITEPSYQYHHAKFDDTGDKFMAFHAFVDANDYYGGKVFDLDGNILDSISYPNAKGAWSPSGFFMSAYSDRLELIDVPTNEVLLEYSYNNTDKSIKNVLWLNDDEVVYTNYDGIFKLNIWTHEKKQIRCACSSRIYNDGNLSQDGTTILYQKATLTPISSQLLNERLELVWIDLATGEETPLLGH